MADSPLTYGIPSRVLGTGSAGRYVYWQIVKYSIAEYCTEPSQIVHYVTCNIWSVEL